MQQITHIQRLDQNQTFCALKHYKQSDPNKREKKRSDKHNITTKSPKFQDFPIFKNTTVVKMCINFF